MGYSEAGSTNAPFTDRISFTSEMRLEITPNLLVPAALYVGYILGYDHLWLEFPDELNSKRQKVLVAITALNPVIRHPPLDEFSEGLTRRTNGEQ